LTTVADGEFKTLADAIPTGLRLTTGSDSYGVPYNVEGYGYIVDTQMLMDLFALESADAMLADIKAESYDEWETLVKAIDAYIKNTTVATVELNGNNYTFAAAKAGLAANLNGVFAVMGSQKWTYGDHFINVAINAAFSSAAAANAATDEEVDSLKNVFVAYAKALDLKTSYLAGLDGAAVRGNDFVSEAKFGYDQTVQIFADSKAVFFKQGNWAYGNIAGVNADQAARLTFLPVKMPMTDADITAEGLTLDKFNSSIPVFVPNYYAINAKATAAEQQAGMDFLVWLNTSEAGKKFIIEDFAFIPYNADPATTTLPNSLGNSILGYVKADKTLAAPYQGAPATWSGEIVGLKILESYMTKETWTDDDYNAIADYAIEQWKELN
jgi:raffinose/stachyose/melibiose transport system substrate-binding protein